MIQAYKRRCNQTREVRVIPFTERDFRAAGHRFDEWGMPVLSASRLIHNWNASQTEFTYWL
ncbi:hypothetical protein WK13_34725 [Burkholderia ubonensis]|nr:hypothetical protein WK13_34725 [Burkholderia ubonensis]